MEIDYIHSMPAGKEIDEMVAEKVMGWHKGQYIYPKGVIIDKRDDWLDADGHFMCGIAREDVYEDDEDFNLLHWHPSQSILWAWEVVEKMKEKGRLYLIISDDIGYKAEILLNDPVPMAIAECDTAPLAICRAALLAIEYESQ